ncbi:MAG TPA: hypothetical protein VH107_17670 [Lacipirellulaceae bacterium]|nr:hypothetical protein [Lacipirellulaceae bacterium]
MTDQEAARWEKKRQQGQLRFTVIFGILLWGLPVGLIWPVAMSAILGWKFTFPFRALSMAVFMFGGIFFGRRLWNSFERRYAARAKAIADRQSE